MTAVLTPKMFRVGFLVIFVLSFVAYLGVEIFAFARPPKLLLFYPKTEFSLNEDSLLTIKGETSRDARVSLNGQELMVSPDGFFEASVYLPQGDHDLNFRVLSRYGRETKLTRYVKR